MSFYLAVGIPAFIIVVFGTLGLFPVRGKARGSRLRRVAVWIVLSAAAWAWAIHLGGRNYWLQAGVLFQTFLFVEVMLAETIWVAAGGAFASVRSSLKRLLARRRREREKGAPCD